MKCSAACTVVAALSAANPATDFSDTRYPTNSAPGAEGEMARNGGAVLDTAARQVRDRNGTWYPLDELAVAGGALYYARPIEGSDLLTYQECWLLPEQAWVVNRFRFHDHLPHLLDWYIETDMTEVDGPLWRIRDGYLDIRVLDGSRYEIEDADELAEGLAAGDIPMADDVLALAALNRLCVALHRHHFSGAALLAEYAPELPR
jgi:predicted RNA-binding protein associated with RNAse of E/G family